MILCFLQWYWFNTMQRNAKQHLIPTPFVRSAVRPCYAHTDYLALFTFIFNVTIESVRILQWQALHTYVS